MIPRLPCALADWEETPVWMDQRLSDNAQLPDLCFDAPLCLGGRGQHCRSLKKGYCWVASTGLQAASHPHGVDDRPSERVRVQGVQHVADLAALPAKDVDAVPAH